jgi:hypothetical protein
VLRSSAANFGGARALLALATRAISQREPRGQASGVVHKLGAERAKLDAAIVGSLPELSAPRLRRATGLANRRVCLSAAKPASAVQGRCDSPRSIQLQRLF